MDFVERFLTIFLSLCIGVALLCIVGTIIVVIWGYLTIVVMGMSLDWALAVGLVAMIAGLTLLIILD